MLTGHSQDSSALKIIDKLMGYSPEYFVSIDPPIELINSNPNTKFVVRHYSAKYDFGRDNIDTALDPVYEARIFVDDCAKQPWFNGCWAVMVPSAMCHESDIDLVNSDIFVWVYDFQYAMNNLLNKLGKVCFVSNLSNGHNGFEIVGATHYAAQEYSWPDMMSHFGHMTGRYRNWFPQILKHQPDAKLAILECGVTYLINENKIPHLSDPTHGYDIGFRGGYGAPSIDWDRYKRSLYEYNDKLKQDPYVLFAAVYGYGMNSDWESFEHLGTDILHDFLMEKSGNKMNHTIKEQYPELFQAWWQAGGWKNFATYLVATDQVEIDNKQYLEFINDRLNSSVAETQIFIKRLLGQ